MNLHADLYCNAHRAEVCNSYVERNSFRYLHVVWLKVAE
jgi:hypothetical protein